LHADKTYTIKYGTATVDFRVPAQWRTETLKHGDPRPFPIEESGAWLSPDPIGCKPLAEWLSPFRKSSVIVPDVTRYGSMEKVLPFIREHYLGNKDTRIIFAPGNHRKQTEAEQRAIVSDANLRGNTIFDHDCFDPGPTHLSRPHSSGLEVAPRLCTSRSCGYRDRLDQLPLFSQDSVEGEKAIFPGNLRI